VVGEDLRSTLWAARRRADAAHQFQRAYALDEAIGLILIRLPADIELFTPVNAAEQAYDWARPYQLRSGQLVSCV
jgi:hypothetical protein